MSPGVINTSLQKPERQSNLELFRIIVMLLIVAHHYVVNSGLLEPMSEHPGTLRTLFYQLFGAWGKTGINCFICITAWFMCKSRISASKVFKLLAQIYFYRIAFYLIFLATGYETVGIRRLVKLLSPIGVTLETNFTSCFIVFYLFIPFLNILIQNLDRKMHLRLVGLLLGLFTVATLYPWFWISFNYVTWFSALYVIVAYLRYYPNRFTDSLSLSRFAFLLCMGLSIASVLGFALLARWVNPRFINLTFFFVSDSNKILAVATGITSFLFFKNLHLSYSHFINTVASTTFGVLCIHANSDAMRTFLWRDLCRNAEIYSSRWFVLHAFGVVLGVFCVCSLIDYARIRLIEPMTTRLSNYLIGRFNRQVNLAE